MEGNHKMLLSKRIIQNFIEAMDEEDVMKLESMSDDSAYSYLCKLYESTYGARPSGAGVYLLRTQFKLGTETENQIHLPIL